MCGGSKASPGSGDVLGMAAKACLFFADQRRLQCTPGFNQLSVGYQILKYPQKMPLACQFTAGLEVHMFCHPEAWHLIRRGFLFIPEVGWKLSFQRITFF